MVGRGACYSAATWSLSHCCAGSLVVPGHMKVGDALDGRSIDFTRRYLKDFIAAIPEAKDSQALSAALKKQYPDAGLPIALDIGAKVAKGEMAW